MLVPLVVALALSAATPAPAGKKGGQWVALIQVRGDAPASWADALRAAAEEARDRTWVPPPAVSIADAQLALGCSGWNDACAGQIASMTGASMALMVDVNGAVISVQSVKAGGAGTAPPEKLELPGQGPADLKLAEELVRGVVHGQRPAFLFVDADIAKAEVSLDGERVGETPWRGKVSAGEHTLVLRAEGKAPLTRQLLIKAGTTTQESHSLNAAGPSLQIEPEVAPFVAEAHEVVTGAEQPPPVAEAPATTTVGWSLAGVGGALGAVGVVFLSATAYDLNNRIDCGGRKNACVPSNKMIFGVYETNQRPAFFDHQVAWISGSVAAVGVGGLIVATGVVLATSPAPEEESSALASGR